MNSIMLQKFLGNPYIMAFLKIFIILYASQVAPRLPKFISVLLDNVFVKIIFITIIALLANVDFQLSLLFAIAFVFGANITSGRGLFETYANLTEEHGPFYMDKTKYHTLLDNPAAVSSIPVLESPTDNYPGCENLKMSDLLEIFSNDKIKLQTTVQNAIREISLSMPESDAKARLMRTAYAVGLNYSTSFTDENAPLIATLLINYGFVLSDKCRAPN